MCLDAARASRNDRNWLPDQDVRMNVDPNDTRNANVAQEREHQESSFWLGNCVARNE